MLVTSRKRRCAVMLNCGFHLDGKSSAFIMDQDWEEKTSFTAFRSTEAQERTLFEVFLESVSQFL